MSYPRLVLDGDNAEAAHELLMHVVKFDFQGGAAEFDHADGPDWDKPGGSTPGAGL